MPNINNMTIKSNFRNIPSPINLTRNKFAALMSNKSEVSDKSPALSKRTISIRGEGNQIGNLVNLKETKRGRTNSNVSDELKSTSSINDILGIGSDEADPDALQDISEVELPNYEPPKCSNRRQGVIRAYAANTNQGISRNYNEDRVSIILNIK